MSRSKTDLRSKILYLDVETAPDIAYVWGVYQTNAIDIKEHWQILTFAWRWGPRGKTQVLGIDDTPRRPKRKVEAGDDWWLMSQLHKLLEEAEIVVAHNGRAFDTRKITARFIALGMKPPSPYKVVDTKNEAARVAAFSSNRLDWLGSQLGLGRKIAHEGFGMWVGCMANEPKAWARMKKYNKHDITLLVKLHERMAPWIRQPNAALYTQGDRCVNPLCGKKKLHVFPKLYFARTRAYKRAQCEACGKWARQVQAIKGRGASWVETE